MSDFEALSFKGRGLPETKRLLEAAVHATHEHIVFEGNVLTNCSWPGKYMEICRVLVADKTTSVLFLPEGSEHCGFHDSIPAKHELFDLHGECHTSLVCSFSAKITADGVPKSSLHWKRHIGDKRADRK